MVSWFMQLHASGQLAALVASSQEPGQLLARPQVVAGVMWAGGSYHCFLDPPLAVGHCAACNASSACTTLGCSTKMAKPCCNFCCPASFTSVLERAPLACVWIKRSIVCRMQGTAFRPAPGLLVTFVAAMCTHCRCWFVACYRMLRPGTQGAALQGEPIRLRGAPASLPRAAHQCRLQQVATPPWTSDPTAAPPYCHTRPTLWLGWSTTHRSPKVSRLHELDGFCTRFSLSHQWGQSYPMPRGAL